MHRFVIGILIATLVTTAALCAQNIVPAWDTVRKSVAVVGYRNSNGTFVEFGTGFCIKSNASSSEFLTDAHLVAPPQSSSASALVVLLANSPSPVAATIVKQSASTDLALVSVPVGNVQPLVISPSAPHEGQAIAVGGFPYTVAARFGGLEGTQQMVPGQSPNLTPDVHVGMIAGLHASFIAFDLESGRVDHGSGGSPLFDPTSGEVYGVVEGWVSGAPLPGGGNDPALYANLATSGSVIRAFLGP
jgi:serine protease Do